MSRCVVFFHALAVVALPAMRAVQRRLPSDLDFGWYQDEDDEGEFQEGPPDGGHSAGTGVPAGTIDAYIFFDASGFPYKYSTITTCEIVPLDGSLQIQYMANGRDIDLFEVQTSVQGPKGLWVSVFSVIGDHGYVRLFYRNGRRESGDLAVDSVKINTLPHEEDFEIIAPQSVEPVAEKPTQSEEPAAKKPAVAPAASTDEKHSRLLGIFAAGVCIIGCCAFGFVAARKRSSRTSLYRHLPRLS
ncbi:hypothetical protein T492DRAFT_873893 [Pavlovales sp. CCMP2436]|nr:hypothetical protein T492DRAFT_873893 [Pavlovales sp. CCMP2436]